MSSTPGPRARRLVAAVDDADRRTLAVLALVPALVVLAAGAAGLAVRVFLWASGLGVGG